MVEFIGLLKLVVGCSSLLFLTFLVLLALPQSKLRAVGLEVSKYAMVAGLILMIPNPADVVPDVIPVLGFADDLGYIVAAIAAFRSARGNRQTRLLYDEAERAELRRRAEGGQS